MEHSSFLPRGLQPGGKKLELGYRRIDIKIAP